jgi:hypothetical protein
VHLHDMLCPHEHDTNYFTKRSARIGSAGSNLPTRAYSHTSPPTAGNMTLWLNNFGLYDRKSTESSNLVWLPPLHAAQEPLPSADMVEIHGEVSIIDPGDIHISCTMGDLSKVVSHSISLDFRD